MFALRESLVKVKIMMINKLKSVKSIGTFIKTDNGFDVTSPEGFVAVDRLSNKALKLVDRLVGHLTSIFEEGQITKFTSNLKD